MTILRVDVLCECEGCQKVFGIEVDHADIDQIGQVYPNLEAALRDSVLGGNPTCYTWGVRGKHTVDRLPLTHQVTIQGGLLLCDECSKACDDLPIEGSLTREQVDEVIIKRKLQMMGVEEDEVSETSWDEENDE